MANLTTKLNPVLEAKQLDFAHLPEAVGQPKPRFLFAFLLFACLIFALDSIKLPDWKPEDSRIQTWTTLSVADFLRAQNRFDLVFLGSSLMLTPLNLADTKCLGEVIDGALHHKSACLEKLLPEKQIKTFNFALPGEMPSDAYLIEKLLLKGKRAPHLVVYGVGPRDFLDNLLDSPAATDPFGWLTKLPDGKPDGRFFGKELSQQSNFVLNEVLFGGHQRLILKDSLSQALSAEVDAALPLPPGVEALKPRALHKLLPSYEPMQIAPGECLFRPDLEDEDKKFANNLDEYTKRYRTLNMNTFATQRDFLDRFLSLAKERGERVLLVSMPITSINRGLIQNSTFKLYEDTLKEVSAKNQAQFLDLEGSRLFTDSDFGDTVHLNSGGGIKMLTLLALAIKQNNFFPEGTTPLKGGAK